MEHTGQTKLSDASSANVYVCVCVCVCVPIVGLTVNGKFIYYVIRVSYRGGGKPGKSPQRPVFPLEIDV